MAGVAIIVVETRPLVPLQVVCRGLLWHTGRHGLDISGDGAMLKPVTECPAAIITATAHVREAFNMVGAMSCPVTLSQVPDQSGALSPQKSAHKKPPAVGIPIKIPMEHGTLPRMLPKKSLTRKVLNVSTPDDDDDYAQIGAQNCLGPEERRLP